MARNQKKIRITRQIIKKTRKLWKWVAIGGNFLLLAE